MRGLQKAFLSFAVLVLSIGALSGCSKIFAATPPTFTAEIGVYGTILELTAYTTGKDDVKKFVTTDIEYDIYRDGEFVETTVNSFFPLGTLNTTSEVYAVARYKWNKKEIKATTPKIPVYKNSNFAESEVMNIVIDNGASVIVPNNVLKAVVTMKEGVVEATNTNIVLADRSADLYIQLNTVSMTAPVGKPCITHEIEDIATKRYTTIIEAKGINVLNAGVITTTPSQPSSNSGNKGGKGFTGASAIYLSKTVVVGDGTLRLNGGKGGTGGKGANSHTSIWAIFARFGDGGTGGTGGSAVTCTGLVVNMGLVGILELNEGKGGDGGRPGDNGSLFTGPGGTDVWSSSFGAKGADGQTTAPVISIRGQIYRG